MRHVFPKEILDNTVQAHQFKHSKKSQTVYSIILLSLIIAIVALPFIHIDIYTSSRGLIKPDKERLAISSLHAGKAMYINLKDNHFVNKGDTLLVLDNNVINEKLKLSQRKTEDVHLFIKDLSYVLSHPSARPQNIISAKYKKEWLLYQQNLQELHTKYRKLKKDYNRNKILYNKGVIAKIEFENTTLDFDLVKNSIKQLKQQQLSTWEATLTDYSNQLQELESSRNQLLENKSEYSIKAPISGTLISVTPLEKGSPISAGQPLASISPNTTLLVECFISPQDIGLLPLNSKVNFQIDAYNYNQWGLATGKVIEIAKDIEVKNNTPVFKVLCQLNEQHLSLKNGFKGQLKKGMTLNAQFKLTERTLFDVLYDKVDDWVNPSQNELVANK
ncbi:HlyD family efflux transporter periplasmic adaptor subunit [Flavobacteriaceae bacterium MHTCC 0001]